MNTIATMKKSILLTFLLIIFSGLLVSADGQTASEYDYFSSQTTVLPSEQTAANAGMFAGGMFGGPQRGWGDDDDGGLDGGDGGTKDHDCGYNDPACPVGNGAYILMLLLSTYGGMLFLRRRKIIA